MSKNLTTIAVLLASAGFLIGCNKTQAPRPANEHSAANDAALKTHPRSMSGNKRSTALSRKPPVSTKGHIAFARPGQGFAIIEASTGAAPMTVETMLGGKFAGKDDSLTLAARGPWMAMVTTRFGCGDWACLAVGRGSAQTWALVRAGGKLVHPEGAGVPSSQGDLVVWQGEGQGKHQRDLYVSRRRGADWSAPKNLTAQSPYRFHAWPSISTDGTKVVFDCGDVPYAGEGTGICEVPLAGTHVRNVAKAGGPGWQATLKAAHHAGYAPDGSIVCEADTKAGGEQVWRISGKQAAVVGSFGNDNSPCVLPDGRIASLYLGRAGSAGHELKVMSKDGASFDMLIEGKDLRDIVLTCGQ